MVIDNMKNEYTILIIAHRLSTVIGADKIMLFDDGKIECVGVHSELLKNSDKYRELYGVELIEDEKINFICWTAKKVVFFLFCFYF